MADVNQEPGKKHCFKTAGSGRNPTHSTYPERIIRYRECCFLVDGSLIRLGIVGLGLDTPPVQELGASLIIIEIPRLFAFLLLKRHALLLVEREGFLEPPKCTPFLFQGLRIARLLRHRRYVAQHAHTHR